MRFDRIYRTVRAATGRQDMKSMALVVSVCIWLGGCAAKQISNEAVAVNAEPGRALIVGFGSTAVENARAALEPSDGTRVSSLFVAKANQQKIAFGQNVALQPPGTYGQTFVWGLSVDYQFFPKVVLMQVELR